MQSIVDDNSALVETRQPVDDVVSVWQNHEHLSCVDEAESGF